MKSDIKHPAHLLWGEGLLIRRADVHVFCVFVLLWALCESIKEALDHSMETQTVCAVQWALSLLWHQCTNIQCVLCVCACVCVFELVKARCSKVNVWWGNEALDKRNKNSRCSPSVPCDSSGQTAKLVLLKAFFFCIRAVVHEQYIQYMPAFVSSRMMFFKSYDNVIKRI